MKLTALPLSARAMSVAGDNRAAARPSQLDFGRLLSASVAGSSVLPANQLANIARLQGGDRQAALAPISARATLPRLPGLTGSAAAPSRPAGQASGLPILSRQPRPQDATPLGLERPGTATAGKTAASTRQPTTGGGYEALIQQAAARHGVSPHLVKAVVTAESDFDPQAVSRAGAMGLMQLMPGTAKDLGVDNPFDPAQNIDGGTRYLAQMLERFDGDEKKALAAYNWGPGNVERGGRLPAETRGYLQKVGRYKQEYAQQPSRQA